MIAIDTNILVYAHRAESKWHALASTHIRELAEGDRPWMITMPSVHEFLSIVTNPKVFPVPSPVEIAMNQIKLWMQSPTLLIERESPRHLDTLRSLLVRSKVHGGAIHDARIAAICLDNGVTQLWTADRDFLRFHGVPAINPLVRPPGQ